MTIPKKDSDVNFEAPVDVQLEAFEEMKNNLANPPMLGLLKRVGSYMVDTDEIKYAPGAVLLQ